eukprot:2195207-Rhodomonas_salina.1
MLPIAVCFHYAIWGTDMGYDATPFGLCWYTLWCYARWYYASCGTDLGYVATRRPLGKRGGRGGAGRGGAWQCSEAQTYKRTYRRTYKRTHSAYV